MQLQNPYLLLILLGLLPYFVFYKKIKARLPFSQIIAAVTFLIILAIADIQVKLTDETRDYFVIIDNSPSVKYQLKNSPEKLIKLIKEELNDATASDKITLLATSNGGTLIAKEIASSELENALKTLTFSDLNESKLTDAINYALINAQTSESTGLIVISDGAFTEDVTKLENSLLRISNNRIAVKLALLEYKEPQNALILQIKSPQQVKNDEVIIFNAKIFSNFDDVCSFNAEFYFDNGKKLDAKTQLYFGETPLKSDDQGKYKLSENSTYNLYIWGNAQGNVNEVQCKLNITSNDDIKFDNTASSSCFVTSGKAVLVFTQDGSRDFLSEFITKNFPNTKIELKNPADASVNAENYLLYKLIVFSDAGAEFFGSKRDEVFSAIHDAVVNGGVNFAMAGGRKSFAPGGFYRSKIEDLLPVSLDPNKNRKRAVTLMLDRSESMNSLIDSVTKISRVCSASVDFVDILSADDFCSFISFADVPDNTGETVDLKKLQPEYKAKIAERLNILGSSRNLVGRTNIEVALREGLKKLNDRAEDVKLLIVFSDGAPTVGAAKPEEFKPLIDEALKNNVHIAFVIAGDRNELFDKIVADLGDLGNVEYLTENWEINEAFRNSLLKAGGKLIYQGKTAVLNAENELFVTNPTLFGYARTVLKKFNNAQTLLQSEKHEPLLATWQIGNSQASAIMLPFNDLDLFWETSVPRQISGFLRNHFKLLFESNESDFEIQTEYAGNQVILTLRDKLNTNNRELKLEIEDNSIELKPVLPGVYKAKFDLDSFSTGKIVENQKVLLPVIFDMPTSQEFYIINAKSQQLKQLIVKYFGEKSLNVNLHDRITPKESKMFSINKIILSLVILLIISWSILLAFKSRK